MAVWYQTLQEYEQLDYRTLSDCAPLLAGEGMISLSNFAQSIELPVSQLIRAVINRNLPVFWLATGQVGFYVDDFDSVRSCRVNVRAAKQGYAINSVGNTLPQCSRMNSDVSVVRDQDVDLSGNWASMIIPPTWMAPFWI